MVDVTSFLAALLLEESPLPSPLPEEPPIDPSLVTPGLLGLISFLFLVIAIVLLGSSAAVETAAKLPEASIDLAFICDVYHHFEYPHATLATLHKALKPGGELVLAGF